MTLIDAIREWTETVKKQGNKMGALLENLTLQLQRAENQPPDAAPAADTPPRMTVVPGPDDLQPPVNPPPRTIWLPKVDEQSWLTAPRILQAGGGRGLEDWLSGKIESLTFFRADELAEPFAVPRASGWSKLSDEFLNEFPECGVCSARNGCVPHHVRPVHLFPDLELTKGNLITLCPRDHLLFGHLGNWRSWNQFVRTDAEFMRRRILNRPTAKVPEK